MDDLSLKVPGGTDFVSCPKENNILGIPVPEG
jgi:hypothetical protein